MVQPSNVTSVYTVKASCPPDAADYCDCTFTTNEKSEKTVKTFVLIRPGQGKN